MQKQNGLTQCIKLIIFLGFVRLNLQIISELLFCVRSFVHSFIHPFIVNENLCCHMAMARQSEQNHWIEPSAQISSDLSIDLFFQHILSVPFSPFFSLSISPSIPINQIWTLVILGITRWHILKLGITTFKFDFKQKPQLTATTATTTLKCQYCLHRTQMTWFKCLQIN